MSFTALGNPGQNQTCVSVTLGKTHCQDRVSPEEAACAPRCSHRGTQRVKGTYPSGTHPSFPKPEAKRDHSHHEIKGKR